MAQYRAIFNNAYFKGLASAALVTVAMAAGQAQAATSDLATALSGTTADSPADSIEINGDDSSVKSGFSTDGYIQGITVKSGTLSLSEQTGHVRTNGVVEVQSGAKLSLSGSSGNISGLMGTFDAGDDFAKAPESQLLVNDGAVDVTMSQLQMSKVDLNNAKVTVKTNLEDSNASGTDWADNAMLNAIAGYESGNYIAGTGVFNVTGESEITLDSGSLVAAAVFNLEGGKIDMTGAAGASGSVIRAYTDGGKAAGELNINGTSINVSGAGNYIQAKTTNINNADSVITVSGTSTLTITGELAKKNLSEIGNEGSVLTDNTVNFTAGKIDLKEATSKLVLDGKDASNKGVKFYANGDAQLVGLGAIDLGSNAKFIADKSILDGFVKPGTDGTTGNGGKINFAKAGSQVTIDSDDVVDLSSYTFGSDKRLTLT